MCFSQTGPGGVEQTNGSSNLVLWLKANAGLTVDGSNRVTSWADQSGYGNTGTGSSNDGRKPVANTTQNSHQSLSWTNDGVTVSDDASLNLSGAFTVFVVFNATNVGQTDALYYKRSGGSTENGLFFRDSRLNFENGSSSRYRANSGEFLSATWYIVTFTYDGTGTSSSDYAIYKNGSAVTLSSSTRSLGPNNDNLGIGSRASDAGNRFSGQLPEIIMYNRQLNTVERTLVENYLGNKYNIAIANDQFAYSSTHQFDIAGIGEDGSSNEHVSSTSDFFNINVPSIASTNTYQIFGHDNGAVGSWVTSDIPTDISSQYVAQRITREWRIDNTGALSNNAVSIPVSSLPSVSLSNYNYILLTDADGTFATGATATVLTNNAGNLEASGLTIADQDYVTVAVAIPDPSAQPTSLNTSYSSPNVSISYTAATGSPDGYIVVRSTDAAFVGSPMDGTAYSASDVIENGTVVYVGTSTSGITDSNVPTGSTLYYYVYSYNGSGSTINYLTTSPLSGTEVIPSTDMTYVSSTVTHPTTNIVIPGHTDRTIIGIEIVTSGNTNALSATSFTFNTDGGNSTGTDNPSTNLLNARLYYTGTTNPFANKSIMAKRFTEIGSKDEGISTYSDSYYSFKLGRWVTPSQEKNSVEKQANATASNYSDQFGTTENLPNGAFTITGTKTLAQGTNYFFLTYDIASGATADGSERVDATCSSVTIGSARTPSVTQPTGSRVIDNYAQSRSNTYTDEHITRVQFAGIDNSSVGSQYTDYTNDAGVGNAEVTRGNSFDLSVYAVTDLNNDYIIAWIDWNNDGDFNDAGEEYQIIGPTGGTGPFTTTVAVPAGATLGSSRMRVSLK